MKTESFRVVALLVISLAAPTFAGQAEPSQLWKVHTQALAMSGQELDKACSAMGSLTEAIRLATNGKSDKTFAISRLRVWSSVLPHFCDGSDEVYGTTPDAVYKVSKKNLTRFLTLVLRDSEIALAGPAMEHAIFEAYADKF